jgi:hypothetical protein
LDVARADVSFWEGRPPSSGIRPLALNLFPTLLRGRLTPSRVRGERATVHLVWFFVFPFFLLFFFSFCWVFFTFLPFVFSVYVFPFSDLVRERA